MTQPTETTAAPVAAMHRELPRFTHTEPDRAAPQSRYRCNYELDLSEAEAAAITALRRASRAESEPEYRAFLDALDSIELLYHATEKEIADFTEGLPAPVGRALVAAAYATRAAIEAHTAHLLKSGIERYAPQNK